MSSISAGTTTTTALVSTADTTGALELKTGASNVTGLSISSAQAVTIPGALTATTGISSPAGTSTLNNLTATGTLNAPSGISSPAGTSTLNNLTVTGTFTASGVGGNYILNAYVSPATWSKPANLKAIKVTVVGAGGDGGAAPATPGGLTYGTSGSGGGGGAAIEYLPAPSIPGPVAVTAGGGTNSFGAFCSATAGGNGGTLTQPASGSPGAGGSGSGGTFNMTGQGGAAYLGGASILGGGARIFSPGAGNTSGAGNNGGNYGGGASGAFKVGPPVGTSLGGGSGAPGIVIVEEFY